MATNAGLIPVRTQLQNAATSGNGTSFDVGGAIRSFLVVSWSAGVTAGVVTFEKSTDGGSEWAALGAAVLLSSADGSTPVATDSFTASTTRVYKVEHLDGPNLIRARISTTVVGGTVSVDGVRVG